MSLLPSEPDTSAAEEADPRVIGVDSDDADDVLSALTSETARGILNELHEDPAPPAELADRVDTSLQNAQYHLNKLEDAGAIEVIDTIYSEKGREMNVYAPADQPLVIFAGKEEQTSGLRAALSRLLGSLGILALASVAVQAVYGEGLFRLGSPGSGDAGEQSGAAGGGGAGGPDVAANASETATPTATETPIGTSYDTRGAETTGEDGGIQIAEATEAPSETATQGGGDPGGATATAEPDVTATATEAPQATGTPQPSTTETPGPAGTPTEPPETVADAATEEATRTVAETATPTATDVATTAVQNATETAATGGAETIASLPPGLVFFAGGATALLAGAAVVYLTQ
jgi:DNA-binding transcriptional ArsR family regulator